MIVDSSAIVSLVLKQPGWEAVLDALESTEWIGIGAPTVVETAIVLSSRLEKDATPILVPLLTELAATTIPFGEDHAREALDAWLRFGKGRHPANLNFGDCMTYAIARLAGAPLLCTGRDFAKTDLQLVMG